MFLKELQIDSHIPNLQSILLRFIHMQRSCVISSSTYNPIKLLPEKL
jgi:hypothetical protein